MSDHTLPSQSKRKKNNKLGPAATGMEAVQNLAAHKKFSRKIDYDQLAKLMQEDDDDEIDTSRLQRLSSVAPGSQQNGRPVVAVDQGYGKSTVVHDFYASNV